MKIGIVHLTDIHFTEKTNLDDKMNSLCRAIINDMKGLEKLYCVISGDVAYSGSASEYKEATKFLSVLKTLVSAECINIVFKYIIVPGNHDCNFEKYDNQLRRNALKSINYQSIGEDNSVLDLCLSVQKDFWDFYVQYNPMPDSKMFYRVEDIIENRKVVFHCINSAWVSQENESVGGIFFPTKRFELSNNSNGNLNIGVWHHPYNWFNPNTNENNKIEFEKFTEQISSTHFFGHEHEQAYYLNENKNTGDKINLLSGELLNTDNKPKNSGFQTLIIDEVLGQGVLKKYNWNGELYISKNPKEINLLREIKRTFKVKDQFVQQLEEIKIPLVIDNKRNIKLSNIFIFPDLDAFNSESNSFENYRNSNKLLGNDCNNCIIDGESQIGKSSLIARLYIKMYENDTFPVLLTGKDFNEPNLEKIVKRAFKSQYITNDSEYEKYLQLETKKKVLLIDDYQDCAFNSLTTKSIFNEAILKFGKVIIMVDSAYGMLPSMKTEFKNVKFYSIKPLGYKKRNELIERYHSLKQNPLISNEQTFLDQTKVSFDNVQSILGDKLMPSYPVYILSILQALEYKPLNQNETSFGYCYQTLLHYSLYKAGVSNDDIDMYLNFLSELAYHLLTKNTECINNQEMLIFFCDYQSRFIIPSYDVTINCLKKSKIISENNSNYKFGYNYILYYLSAKKIADILHKKEGKDVIQELFREMHVEKNANILVFVTHHSKDVSFIEESLLNSMTVLDKCNPITLEKNDPFYLAIEEFAEKITNDILEINKNPRTERDNLLEMQDENQRSFESKEKVRPTIEDDYQEISNVTLPFQRSFRSIEIIGQIIKNRRGSLEIKQLTEMLTEVYTTGFRTISYYSELLDLARKDIIKLINEQTNESDNKREIEKKINHFIQINSFQICLGVFVKLSNSLGNKDLKKIYNDVAKKINTPAAKLVSFSINSYYGTISYEELKALADDLKGNIVALRILRARVRSYVYNKNLDFRIKQKFAGCLNMTLGPATKSEYDKS